MEYQKRQVRLVPELRVEKSPAIKQQKRKLKNSRRSQYSSMHQLWSAIFELSLDRLVYEGWSLGSHDVRMLRVLTILSKRIIKVLMSQTATPSFNNLAPHVAKPQELPLSRDWVLCTHQCLQPSISLSQEEQNCMETCIKRNHNYLPKMLNLWFYYPSISITPFSFKN